MFCVNCGCGLDDDTVFCPNCGTKILDNKDFIEIKSYCIYCGTTFNRRLDYCEQCGKSIVDQSLKVKELDKEIYKHPYDYHLYQKKGDLLASLNLPSEAVKAYDKVSNIKQYYEEFDLEDADGVGSEVIYQETVDEEIEEKSYEDSFLESLNPYKEAVVEDPKNDALWNSYGVALADLKYYEESIVMFDKALEIRPNNEIFLNHKGSSLEHLKRYDEALECYSKAFRLNRFYDESLDNKLRLLRKLGRFHEADVFESMFRK